MSENKFACYCKKIVTVSEKGTIRDGVIIVNDGKIEDIGTYIQLKDKLNDICVYEYKDKVITPSLIDCHCHLLEYAPGSLYPVTKETSRCCVSQHLFPVILRYDSDIGTGRRNIDAA